MKHSEIEGIIEKRFGMINTAFDNVRMHLNEDDIRLFRVKVKKLAAFLNLFDAAKQDSHPFKIPRKITKTYLLSGTIRKLQIQQNQIQKTLKGKEIIAPERYSKLISDEILQNISAFKKHLKGINPFKKEEEKLLALLPRHLSQKTVQQFIQLKRDAVKKLLLPVFLPDKTIHELRKTLKNLLYILPYLKVDISTLTPNTLLCTSEDIRAFTIVLGVFHDLDTAIGCLHKACQKIEIVENEKEVLRNIENLWVKERESFRQKIYDVIQKITVSDKPAISMVKWP